MEEKPIRFFWVCGGGILLCAIGMLALGDLGRQVPLFFLLLATAMVAYLLAVRHCRQASLGMVIVFGILCRIVLLFSSGGLSDDIYRYVWDGRVQDAGINPFLDAPASEALVHLRDQEIFPRINHPDVPTIYPPFAQFFFRACYAIYPSLYTIKIALVGFDLLTAWFLLGLIRLYDQHPGQLLIYLWNPLLLVEVAGNGHVDILAVAFMVFALLYVQIGGYGRAFAALALSFLSKFFVISLVPVFWRWICARGASGVSGRLLTMVDPRRAWPILIFVALVILGYFPFRDAGTKLFEGLFTYAEHWAFNAPIFELLQVLLGTYARAGVGLIFTGAVLAISMSRMPPIQAGYFLAGIFLWLSPTLHPWYVIWIIPFLVFYPHPAWLVFTGLVCGAYHVLIRYSSEGVWEEAGWVKAVELGGFLLVWAAMWVGGRFLRR